MTRAPVLVVASILVACSKPVAQAPELGETGSDTTESTGDGDGDVPLLEPCSWVPVPAAECDVAFTPASPEPPVPAWTYQGVSHVGINAHANAVEVLWVRYFADDGFEPIESRRYVASNAEGAWQHQFLHAAPCEGGSCEPSGPPRIRGSLNRTQITPPYMRREGGQWQAPVIDAQTDPLAVYAYEDPIYFAVGPDDRSYFVVRSSEQQQLVTWLWAETELGCHVPTWRLELEPIDCPANYVSAITVDAAGLVHMTGAAQAAEGDWRIVHWLALPDGVEGHELERLPAGVEASWHDLAVAESGEIHLCHWELDGRLPVYGHGYDADDWKTREIEDPDADAFNAEVPGYCKLALATDGTVWLTWKAGQIDATDPFRVASIVDDVISYETIDVGVDETWANLTVDPAGRPWIVYELLEPDLDPIKVAHKDGDQWIIEEIPLP